jgi:hypothetical protein
MRRADGNELGLITMNQILRALCATLRAAAVKSSTLSSSPRRE